MPGVTDEPPPSGGRHDRQWTAGDWHARECPQAAAPAPPVRADRAGITRGRSGAGRPGRRRRLGGLTTEPDARTRLTPALPEPAGQVADVWESVVLEQRARFHASFRLAGRAFQIALARHAGAGRRRLVLAGGCAVADIIGSWGLARSSRFHLGPRLVADAVDCAAWGLLAEQADASVLAGVPLALEAGIRMGWRATVVPAVTAGTGVAVRRLAKRPGSVGSYRWHVVGAGMGAIMRAYERAHHRAVGDQHQQHLQAQVHGYELAGKTAVAMGADSVVDLLSRTMALLASVRGDASVAHMLATWKQQLAQRVAGSAVFLGMALTSWQQAHNSRQQDLRSVVRLLLPEGDGTVLLTAGQAGALSAALDAMGLRGDVEVEVVDRGEAMLPGRRRQLVVAGRHVTLAPDREHRLAAFDPGPLVLVLAALWSLETMGSHHARTSPWASVPAALGGVALAWWAHDRVRALGARAHSRILVASLGLGAVQAVLSTATMRQARGADGVQRFPFVDAMTPAVVLLAFYGHELDRWRRALVWAVVVGVGACCLASMEGPIDGVDLAAGCLWPASAIGSLTGLGQALASSEDRVVRAQEADDAACLDAAYDRGRRSVIDLVAAVRDDAWAVLAEGRGRYDAALADEVQARLCIVDRRLEDLRCAVSPS